MKLVLAKTLWGVDGVDDENQWDNIFQKIVEDGYTMIECVPAFTFGGDPKRASKFRKLATEKHGLQIICLLCSSGGYYQGTDFVYCSSFDLDVHLRSVEKEIDLALQVNPVHINCHGGVDAWDHETQIQFLLGAIKIAKTKDVSMSFETHRQRIFCDPFQTRALLADKRLQDNHDLKITADLSHWVVACERQLHTPSCCWASRDPWWTTQVPDVTDPTFRKDVQAHLEMWSEIWTIQRDKMGLQESWCEMEHGAAPYLWTLPHTGMPMANLWKVNNDLAKLVRMEFEDMENVEKLNASFQSHHSNEEK